MAILRRLGIDLPQVIVHQSSTGSSTRQLRYSADRLIEVKQGNKVLGSYSHNTHGQRIDKTLGDGITTG